MSIYHIPQFEGLDDLASNMQSAIIDPVNTTSNVETALEAIIDALQAYGMVATA